MDDIFNIGDRVICIDNSNSYQELTINKVYTITNKSFTNKEIVFVINDFGYEDWFNIRLFILEKVYNRNQVIDGILE